MDERRGTLEADDGSLKPDTKAPHDDESTLAGRVDAPSDSVFPVLDPTSVHSPQPTLRAKTMRFTYPSGSTPLEGYTLKRGIGIGGFGEVYFALSDAGKEVALKRIQRNLDIELRGVKQCLNLKHVNLISLWDIRTCGAGESWVIMEYVPGDSLRDVIEPHASGMPIDQVHFWLGATAAGVAYLHDRGIVHRDLKPGNIFRDMDEQVIKIGDYGLSKFISCSNRDGQTESVGTFHYMAPEIGKGVYGKEIDIYALGIILFEMLTGRLPFEGESSQEIIMKHLTAIPDLTGIPPVYARVIAKALEKDPSRRYSNVAEMIGELPLDDVPNMPSLKTYRENQVANSNSTSPTERPATAARPPIQPMFMEQPKFFIGDDQDIRFGEVQQVNQAAQPSQSPNHGAASQPHLNSVPPATSHYPELGREEPIAKVVRGTWGKIVHWWYYGNVSTPFKIAILVGAVLLLVVNSAWLVPSVLSLGLVYLLYYLVLTITSPAENAAPQNRPMSKAEMRARVRHQLAARPTMDRVTEAIGSLFLACLVCGTLGLLGFVVMNEANTLSSQSWAFYLWSVTISAVGSSLILIASKFWETRAGETVMRRLVSILFGMGIGCFGLFVQMFLRLNWSSAPSFEEVTAFSSLIPMRADGPSMASYLAFFAGLFFVLRWWKQADPLRKTRLSIWRVGMCLVWGSVLGQVLGIPLPWSCLIAVSISVAIQLAAPWLSPDQCRQLALARPPQPQTADSAKKFA